MSGLRARFGAATIVVALAGATPISAWDPANPDDPAADTAAQAALDALGPDRGALALVSDTRDLVSDVRDVVAVAAALDFSTVFVDPHPLMANGTIGFTYAGDIFVGSVQRSGTGGVLYSTDLNGKNVTVFAPDINIPSNPSDEHFVASSLGLGGFPNRDIYIAAGNGVMHIDHAGIAGSTFVGDLDGAVRGILFDAVGTFGNDMLITTNSGHVYRVDSAGKKTLLASVGEDTEGLDVAPMGPGAHLGPYNGQLIVASEGSGKLRAISREGRVTELPLKGEVQGGVIPGGPEELTFVPLNLGPSADPVEGFYGSSYTANVIKVPARAFEGLQGDIILTLEFDDHAVMLVQYDPADGKFAVRRLGKFPGQPEDGIFVTPAIVKKTAQVIEEQGRVRIVLPAAILFDFDRFNLKPSAEAALREVQGSIIDKYPGAHLIVEGHTDDRGTQEYNLKLSARRVQSVATWLKEHGISTSLLETKGYGKIRPRYPNTNEENRASNRRVEIIVLK